MKNKIIVLAAFSFILIACDEKKTAGNEPVTVQAETATTNSVELTSEQIKNAGIAVAAPEVKDMRSTLKVNGTIDVPPQNIVEISVPLGGYLKSMNLLPGMPIKRAAVLATLEGQEYIQLQQDYLMGKSKLEFLAADYERQKGLNETQSISNKVYQQVKGDYESQKVLVKGLSEKLKLIGINPDELNESNISRSIRIYSPISGYVSKVNVNIGKYLTATDVLFELVNPADLHLSLTVFEKDIPKLSVGQRVVCYTNNDVSKKYIAEISLINRSISAERASEVHCHFRNGDGNLQPGMFMNAEIEVSNNKVTAVPDDAIVRWQNKHFIFVAETDKKFVMTPVELGDTYQGYTAIQNEISNRGVVIRNAYTLLMKMKNSSED